MELVAFFWPFMALVFSRINTLMQLTASDLLWMRNHVKHTS
jgi:hypothetical protein